MRKQFNGRLISCFVIFFNTMKKTHDYIVSVFHYSPAVRGMSEANKVLPKQETLKADVEVLRYDDKTRFINKRWRT